MVGACPLLRHTAAHFRPDVKKMLGEVLAPMQRVTSNDIELLYHLAT